jgi:hypothetical protein
VAELIDHRGTGLNAERRLRFAWFGEGSSTKARTFRVAKDMLSGRR